MQCVLNRHLVYVTLLFLLITCKSKESTEPQISPKSYKDIAFTQALFERTSGWIAGDGGASIALSDGRTLWTFGDSWIDNYDLATKTVFCLFQVRNASVVTDNNNPTQAQTLLGKGQVRSFFQYPTDNGFNFWLWGGLGYQNKDTVYVFLERFRATGAGGAFGFESIKNCFAKVKMPSLSILSYHDLPSYTVEGKPLVFTNGAIKNGDGYVYIYASVNLGLASNVYVARFPENNIHATWEYYAGNESWTKDISKAKMIGNSIAANTQVIKIKDKYVLTTMTPDFGCSKVGAKVYAIVADKPYGFFDYSKKIEIWQVDDLLNGFTPFCYLPFLHPQLTNSKNEILLTYCLNGYPNCVNTCVNNRTSPLHSAPRAVRVPLELLGIK